MPGIYIGSTAAYSGKNMLTLGMGLWLRRQGFSVGYMKPVGALPVMAEGRQGDEDAFFVRRGLGLPPADPAQVTPVLVTREFQVQAFQGRCAAPLEDIRRAYAALSAGTDAMLVAGSGSMYSGRYCGVDGVTLVRELGLRAVVVDRHEAEPRYDDLLVLRQALGERLAGVVLNDVPEEAMDEVAGQLAPFLESNGVRVLGVLPRTARLAAITVAELAGKLEGHILVANHKGANRVERFLIGTMQVENFLGHYRRQKNAAVIVGGDRSDLQLVAMEGDSPCIILTGNLQPNPLVLQRAQALDTPLLAVREDTFSVAKKMEALLARHKLRDQEKVEEGARLVEKHLDMARLQRAIGL